MEKSEVPTVMARALAAFFGRFGSPELMSRTSCSTNWRAIHTLELYPACADRYNNVAPGGRPSADGELADYDLVLVFAKKVEKIWCVLSLLHFGHGGGSPDSSCSVMC